MIHRIPKPKSKSLAQIVKEINQRSFFDLERFGDEVQVALGLKNPELLVTNERVEKVFYQLQQMVKFPDSTQFVAYIQEPSKQEPNRLAIFMVTSPHPKDNARSVISFNAVEYEQWREIEQSYRHYAGMSDPIRPIFAQTLRRHLQQVKNLEELNA